MHKFNTLDNWGHKTPTQSKKGQDDRKEKIKGHGPEHTQYIQLHEDLAETIVVLTLNIAK